MAFSNMSTLLFAIIAATLIALSNAQLRPGSRFPYFDQCRKQQANQMRTVTYLGVKQVKGVAEFCWRVGVLPGTCAVETFLMKKVPIKSRCCDTTLTKIKFYANVECRRQFLPSRLTVPLAPGFSKIVSPNWESTRADQLDYTSVKYTQFGPIPQSKTNGVTFCLRVAAPTGAAGSTCRINNGLRGIASKTNQKMGVYQLALYDKKVDNYECCPTFNFKLGSPNWTQPS